MLPHDEPPLAGPSHGFPSTAWTDVELAGRDNGSQSAESLSKVLTTYQAPLLSHLAQMLAQRGLPPEEAQDLFQDFVLNKIVEKGILSRACRTKGRFRGFIVEALDNHVRDHCKKANALKRRPEGGTCPLEEHQHAIADVREEQQHAIAWTNEIIKQTLARMELECQRLRQLDLWRLFQVRVVDPILNGASVVPYESLVREFDFPSPGAAAKALMQAKKLFRECLRTEVGRFPGVNVDEEIQALRHDLINHHQSGCRNPGKKFPQTS